MLLHLRHPNWNFQTNFSANLRSNIELTNNRALNSARTEIFANWLHIEKNSNVLKVEM